MSQLEWLGAQPHGPTRPFPSAKVHGPIEATPHVANTIVKINSPSAKADGPIEASTRSFARGLSIDP